MDTKYQPSTSDATRCAKCGEPFGRIWITIGGSTYHDGCARNLPLDYAALRSKVEELTAARTVTELAVWEFIRELRYEGLIVSRNAFAAVEKMKAALTPSVNSQHSDGEAGR